jgi:hypothetical protein
MKIEFSSFLTMTGWLFLGLMGCLTAVLLWKLKTVEALRQNNDAWKSVAEARGEKGKDLETQLAAQITRNDSLSVRNDALITANKELQALNLNLQTHQANCEKEIEGLKHQNEEYARRLTMLEAELFRRNISTS